MTDKPATPAAETAAAPLAPAAAATATAAPSPSSASPAASDAAAGKTADGSPASSTASSSDAAPPSTRAQEADGAAKAAEPAGLGPSLLSSTEIKKSDGDPKADAAATPPPADAKAKPETGDGKTPEVKPEPGKDAAKDGADAAAKDALAPEPPAQPVYEAPKLPDGVTLDGKMLAKVDKEFGDFQNANKVDHAAMQTLRQKMVNEGLALQAAAVQQYQEYSQTIWSRKKEAWINEFKSDPELGGSRANTTLVDVKSLIHETLGKERTDKFMADLDMTGMSSNPEFLRVFAKLARRVAEPQPVAAFPASTPAASKMLAEPGNRGWYNEVDGKKTA